MRTTVLVLAVAAGLASTAAAQTIHKVPQEHATIQAAVDAAASGDTILISAGTYPESVTVEALSNLLIKGKGKVIIAPSSGAGLVLDTCDHCTVEKIRVEGGDVGFDLIETTDSVLSKCRVEGTTSDGICLENGSNDVVEKCIVTDVGTRGIALVNAGGNVPHDDTVTHCKVTGSGGDGIVALGEDNLVDHCTVLDPGGRGLSADDVLVCKTQTFTHCKVTGALSDGIAITGVSEIVSACKVVKCTNIGIVDLGGFLDEIDGCKVTKAGTVGIATDLQTIQVSVHDCKVTAATNDGIALTGMGHVVADNKVSKAGEDGVDISAAACDITGNKANGSTADGFRLSAGANNNSLSFNKAHGSGGFDFDDVSGDGTNEVDSTNDFGTVGP